MAVSSSRSRMQVLGAAPNGGRPHASNAGQDVFDAVVAENAGKIGETQWRGCADRRRLSMSERRTVSTSGSSGILEVMTGTRCWHHDWRAGSVPRRRLDVARTVEWEWPTRQASDCIFCRIARGELGTEFVAESEHNVAFRDLASAGAGACPGRAKTALFGVASASGE